MYNRLDTEVLFDVVNKFSESVFDNYGVDITTSTTIASLAIKVYLSGYYD